LENLHKSSGKIALKLTTSVLMLSIRYTVERTNLVWILFPNM